MMDTSFLEKLQKIARRQEFDTILEEIEVLQDLQKEKYLDVVVLGQFKAGKSSFLNEIFRKEILPVGVLPVTAIVTRVFYGADESAEVVFLDGKREKVPLKDLSDFITEKKNPENKKGVYFVDITLPQLKVYNKLRFIDTPGLGSIFQHNSKVTEQWFNRIGAALVVISAAQPLSERDISVIKNAVSQSPQVHLILSKTDLLNEKEINEVTEFLHAQTKKLTDQKLDIFPYSIKKNTEALQKNIEKSIFQSLSENFSTTRDNIYHHKVIHLLELTKSYLDIRLRTSSKKEEERLELKNKILDEQMQFSFIQKELFYITRHYQEITRKILEKEIIEGNQKKLEEKLRRDLEINYETWHGNLNKISRNYEKWLRRSMEENLRQIELEKRALVDGILKDAQAHFNNYCLHFRERLNHRIEEVLHVKLPKEDFNVTVETLAKPDISTSWAFESHIDMLWFLIPMFLLRKVFLRSFQRQLPSEVEKNLRRLVAILTKNINKAIEKSHIETHSYIETRLKNIEQLLNGQTSDTDDLNQSLEIVDLWLSSAK